MLKYLTRKNCFFSIVFVSAVFIFFFNIHAYFDNWDEAWYAEMTRQMLRHHEFVLPIFNGEYYFDKPPFYLWMSSFWSLFFHSPEVYVRLTSVLSGIATTIIVAVYSYKKWGLIPSIFAVSSLLCNALYVSRTRDGDLDGLVTLYTLLTFLLIVSSYKRKYLYLGLLFGIFYLTKGALAAFPVAMFVLSELITTPTIKAQTIKNIAFTGFISLIIALAWLIPGYMKGGMKFFSFYIFSTDFGAADVNADFFNTAYLHYLVNSLKLYTPFFVIGLIGSLWQHKKLEHILLIFFSLSLLIFLSFSSIMYNWYLLPSMPFWSLLMAYSAYLLLRIATLRKYMRVVLVLLNLGIAAFMFFKVVLPDLKGNSTYYQVMAANKIKELSKPTDVVVRMDDLYPTTIYYTDRKVYSSPYQKNQQYWLFIYRYTVAQGIKNHEYQWLSGKEDDINAFLPKNVCPSWQMIKPSPSSDEVIVHFN